MTPRRFVGIQPRFPGFLNRWKWLTEPVPAERVAALRIAAALALLVDLVFGYLPEFATLFSADGLGGKDLFPARFRPGHFYWSVLRWLPDSWGPAAVMGRADDGVQEGGRAGAGVPIMLGHDALGFIRRRRAAWATLAMALGSLVLGVGLSVEWTFPASTTWPCSAARVGYVLSVMAGRVPAIRASTAEDRWPGHAP